ncbi:hypothetical protein SAY86_008343 [Trapa natans]|uniref:Uncharacterized protein n=1 Tax=Trapa natans TaxID=22666 RepID=A0AAN7QEC2_TRANT|nr:hypothetical protein SAY86_008343 [Trapa natans]
MYTEMPPASQLIQQPGLNGSGQWSAGLCDCFSEFRLFCLSSWCPCITFGQVSEIIDRGTSSCEVNCRIHFAILCITGMQLGLHIFILVPYKDEGAVQFGGKPD